MLQYGEVQRVLREDIVNPLRRRLFVRADKVMALRTLLDTLSSVSGLTDQEKDPEEFLNSLFNQVARNPFSLVFRFRDVLIRIRIHGPELTLLFGGFPFAKKFFLIFFYFR